MSEPPRLIARLADGAWHAGPDLAAALGVSRAAVSARVAELRRLGLVVHSVAGRGYRLAAPIELLSAPRIRAHLDAVADDLDELIVLERCDSTNAELARRDGDGMRACLAEYQSAGRGRAERAWTSPFGANLALSLACDMTASRAPLGALSLAVGVCVVEALGAFGARGLALKWPNDIWVDGRKLAGILIEHRGEIGGRARLIVGLGVNVHMDREQAAAIDQPWTRLADHMAEVPSRNRLAATLLGALIEAVTVFERHGFESFRERWNRLDWLRDRAVRVLESRGEREGVARGIAPDGALRIEADGRVQPVYSGDVSLRVVH